MFSKRLILALAVLFTFLSISTLIVNMPEKKDSFVIEKIKPYFPYKIVKTLGGLDLIDKRTNKKLGIANEKIFLAYDNYLKNWGKTHLKLNNSKLTILDDNQKEIDSIELNKRQQEFVKRFFFNSQ
jgi:hypothetical protein